MPLSRSVGIRRVAGPAALSAALLLTAAACSSTSTSGSSSGTAAAAGGASPAKACANIPAGPINVYNIVPLTGPTATSGQLIEAIAGVAADYFNAHGSICGHQIAVHNIDDKGDPATSLGIARQLVTAGDTIVMQDSFGAAEDLIHPYLMQHKVLIVNGNGAYSLYNAKQNPYSFSVGPSNQEYAEVMVNWAKSHGYNNIGILTDGSSFGSELTADALADIKAAGLHLVKVVTYSPTSIVLTTPVEQLRQAGAQTVFPDGFTDVLQIVQAIKQVGWNPHLVGWGNLAVFGVTAAQVPPGTVDSCDYRYTPGQPTSTLLTPMITGMLKAEAAKIGINTQTYGVIGQYIEFQALAHAIETADSLSGPKMAAALDATSNLPTVVPGLNLTFTATPSVHNGYPLSYFTECTMQTGPYDLRYAAG
jgi:ABC-type branched-subunit amino acid transport system substrate-binding protein